MERFDSVARGGELWAAALRDAAGPLSAYLTPTAFALERVSVQSLLEGDSPDFAVEIESRLDLGRADAFLELLTLSTVTVTSVYRHVLSYSMGHIRGKVDIPRYVLGRARKDKRGIPVIFARRNVITPENLLVSEAFRLCIGVCEFWKRRGGAESIYASELWRGLQQIESTFPWNELRTKARPSLSELVGIVGTRIHSGQVEPGSFYEQIHLLFSSSSNNKRAFAKAATPISMLLTQSPEFEDRVFELLCLAWIITALRSCCARVSVNPLGLRGPRKEAVATCDLEGGKRLTLSFQSADLLPVPKWIDRRTSTPFRALPDLVLEINDGVDHKLIIVDAKNRTSSSESEVAYKLMGYRDNLGLHNYQALGVYPAFEGHWQLRRLQRDGENILLVHAPLGEGKHLARRLVKRVLLKN